MHIDLTLSDQFPSLHYNPLRGAGVTLRRAAKEQSTHIVQASEVGRKVPCYDRQTYYSVDRDFSLYLGQDSMGRNQKDESQSESLVGEGEICIAWETKMIFNVML